MGQYVLLLVVALTVGAVVFGVTVLVSGSDPGLGVAEPDGRAVPLPGTRPLLENDVTAVRFDTAVRGYRMAQVDQAMQRAAYDIGYKDELISVLEAEVSALREGRTEDAEVLRSAREAAVTPPMAEEPVIDLSAGDGAEPVPVDEPVAADAPVPAEERADEPDPADEPARPEDPAVVDAPVTATGDGANQDAAGESRATTADRR